MMDDTLPYKKRRHSTTPLSPMFIPDELIVEILSFLNVKTILQLKCVCKTWNTLITDPTLIKKHLKKSSQNPHLTLFCKGFNVAPFPLHRLLKNPFITVCSDIMYPYDYRCTVVGSYNGLLCVVSHSITGISNFVDQMYFFRFMNPSMRTTSKILGLFRQHPSRSYQTSSFRLF